MTRSVLDDLPGVGPGAQAQHPPALRLARALPGGQPRGARGGAGAAAEGGARHPRLREQDPMIAGLRRHHGLQRRGQVPGDGHLRGRRLLLRRQPAAGDDRLAGRPVRPRGQQGRARGRRLRHARRRATSTGWSRCSRTSSARGVPYRLLFLEASEEVLINRFKETRRRHPLADGGSVEAAIAARARAAGAADGARGRVDRHLRPVAPRGCARWWPTRCSRAARSAGSRSPS